MYSHELLSTEPIRSEPNYFETYKKSSRNSFISNPNPRVQEGIPSYYNPDLRMDYNNRNSWNLWVHPVWNAFLSNPAYYYYCTAKAALMNQPAMVRKTGNGNAALHRQQQSQAITNPMVPVGLAGVGGNGINNVLKLFGVEECPECKSPLDLTENRPLKEFCGHIRCRRCLIKETPCNQCQMAQPASPIRKVTNNGSVTSTLPIHKAASVPSPTPRIYSPRVYGTTKSNNGGSAPNFRVLRGQETNGPTVDQNGFVGNKYRPPEKVLLRTLPATSVPIAVKTGTLSLETVKASKSPPNGLSANSIPKPIVEVMSSGKHPLNPPSHPNIVMHSMPSTSTATTIHTKSLPLSPLKISRSPSYELSPPVSVSETPTSSNLHEELSGSDEQNSSSSELNKEKRKKKRNPVVIHDHITVISGEPTMFQCNVCMKKFKTKAHIKYHEFCQNGEKPFKCEQCGQGFIAKSHYEYHLRTHTGERPYVCPKCGKGFNQRGKVTRHMRSHTGEKPFVCSECGRGFANAQALRSHHLIHTGERPFACKYCNKRFTGMTNLKKHIITHTGERPYVCTHCGKSFGLKWTLDLHLRTHSSERPYACDQCTRAFSNSKDLRRHLVIHSGERPFKCWICGTAFRRKDNLDRHIKNTHNQPKEVAKQLANEAAAEYLAINANSPVPASKVNSAVISNVIRTAQLNGPHTQTLKEPMKIGSGTKKRKLKKAKPVLSVIAEEPSTPKENEVIITAPLSPCDAVEKIEQEDSHGPVDDYFVPSSPHISSAPTMTPSPTSQLDVEGTTDAASEVIMAHLSLRNREEKPEPESFDNYILPDTEDSFMRFTSGSAAEEKLHTESPRSGSFVAFASQCEVEEKLHTETPRAINGLSDFSKSRNLIPSDCGIRIFDKACTTTVTDPQIDLTSIIAHASGDEDSEQVFVDEKETQTIVEELNGTLNTNLKILVGRARSIFPEGDDEMERHEEESYHLHDKETNPKDEDVEREDEPPLQTKADETEVEDHILDTEPMEIPEISGDLGDPAFPKTESPKSCHNQDCDRNEHEENLVISEDPSQVEILVGRARSIFPEGDDEMERHEEESYHLHEKETNPKDEEVEREDEPPIQTKADETEVEDHILDTEPMEIPEISGDLGDPAFPKTESPKSCHNQDCDRNEHEENLVISEDPSQVGILVGRARSIFPEGDDEMERHEEESYHLHDKETNPKDEDVERKDEPPIQTKADETEVEDHILDTEPMEIPEISGDLGDPAFPKTESPKSCHNQDCDRNEHEENLVISEDPSQVSPEIQHGTHTMGTIAGQNGPRFYFQQNPGEPYTGNMYYPSQISVDHPYSPNNQQQNMNLVYATATAQAEKNDDDSGPPLKFRILHAEALGVESYGEDLSGRRIIYAAARPNQLVGDYSSSSLALSAPAIIHPPEGRDGSPQVTLHQYRYEQQQDASSSSMAMQSQYPVEVAYDNDGIVHAQAVCDHPDRFTLINRAREVSHDLQGAEYYRRDWNVPEPFVRPIYASNQQNSPFQQEYPNSHQQRQADAQYYGQVPNVQEPMHDMQQQGPSQGYSIYNPLRELAAEATRRLSQTSQESYDATIAAAAAIAAVGEEARKQREEELKNREMRRQFLDDRLRYHEEKMRENRRKSAASRKSYY